MHHILYLSNYGTSQKSNLITLCRACHEKEHERSLDFGEDLNNPRAELKNNDGLSPPKNTTLPTPPKSPEANPPPSNAGLSEDLNRQQAQPNRVNAPRCTKAEIRPWSQFTPLKQDRGNLGNKRFYWPKTAVAATLAIFAFVAFVAVISVLNEKKEGNTHQKTAILHDQHKPSYADISVYSSIDESWKADVEEFLWFYPQYSMGKAHELLDQHVRAKANEHPGMTGTEILSAAHRELIGKGYPIKNVDDPDIQKTRFAYERAISGNSFQQGILSAFYYLQVEERHSPSFGEKRSTYWAKQAADAGDETGVLSLGHNLFTGFGIQQDKVRAYLILDSIKNTNELAAELLKVYATQMTAQELSQVR